MTPQEFYDGPLANMHARCYKIMRSKMTDYAGDDFAGNFKRTAERAGTTPGRVWLTFFDKHVGAIYSFIRNGRVESEDICNRIADAINYLGLLAGLVETNELRAACGSPAPAAGGEDGLGAAAVPGGVGEEAGRRPHGNVVRTALTPAGASVVFEDGTSMLRQEAKDRGLL